MSDQIDAQERIHIFPIIRRGRRWRTTHCTDKTGMCWCKPDACQPCSESPGRDDKCPENCWRCGGTSTLPVWNDYMSILIIHKEGQRPVYPGLPDIDLGAK